jgi:folate-binding protein YgfZ
MAFFAVSPQRNVVSITGKDARAYLQTKLTVHTGRWLANGGSYGYATDINGRIVFDADFRALGAGWLAVLGADLAEPAIAHLDRYVIREDVVLSDESARWLVVELPTEDGLAALQRAGGPALDPDEHPFVPATLAGVEGLATWRHWAGAPGALLLLPRDAAEPALAALEAAGAERWDAERYGQWLVLQGQPVLGRELIPGETIPLEAGNAGVDFNKGCYLGQEIIERLSTRGTPARRLIRLELDGAPPESGTALLLDGEDVGRVTASAPGADGAVALAWLRRKAFDAATALHCGDRPVRNWAFTGA